MSFDRYDLPSGVSLHCVWCTSASDTDLDLEIRLVAAYLAGLAATKNSRSRGLLCLPVELLDLIFDDIYADYGNHSMRACALACKVLVPFAQRRMFSSFRISTSPEWRNTLQLIRARPELCDYIQSLEVHYGMLDPDDGAPRLESDDYAKREDIDRFFGSLHSLKMLHLVSIARFPVYAHDHSATQSIARMLPRIKGLVLEGCTWDRLSDFNQFIFTCTSLQTLELLAFRVRDFDENRSLVLGPEIVRPLPMPIQSLKVDVMSSSATLYWFAKYLAPDTLLFLDCPLPTPGMDWGMASIWLHPSQLLGRVGARLQRVHFSSEVRRTAEKTMRMLSESCPDIQEATILAKWNIEKLADMMAFLENLKGYTGQSLTLIIHNLLGVQVELSMMHDLCKRILVETSFPMLRAFHLQFSDDGFSDDGDTFQLDNELECSPKEHWSSQRVTSDFTVHTSGNVYDILDIMGDTEDGLFSARRAELHVVHTHKEWPGRPLEDSAPTWTVSVKLKS